MHTISPNLEKREFGPCARVRGPGSTREAPPPLRSAPAWPWTIAWPPPTRPEPPRGRRTLPTASISPPGDCALTRRANGAREAASRRQRWPPSEPRALHARLRGCRRRRDARRPPPRPSGGRYGRCGTPSGLSGRSAWRAAATLRRPCGLRRRGKRGRMSRERRGGEVRAARRWWRRHPAALTAACVHAHA